MTTRDLLFRGDPWVARFFTQKPHQLFVSLSILSLMTLVLPAHFIHIDFISNTARQTDRLVGFLTIRNWNWVLMFPLVLPIIFACTAWLSDLMCRRIDELSQPGKGIIRPKTLAQLSYIETFADELGRKSRYVFLGTLTLAVVFSVLDTGDIARGVLQHYSHPGAQITFQRWDWTVAFLMDHSGQFQFRPQPPSGLQNLTFDLVAYLLQFVAIFLGLFWVGKFWLFLKTFSDLMIGEQAVFEFHPYVEDKQKRLGLYNMGMLFDAFLVIAIMFQSYVFLHRLQLIDRKSGLVHFFHEAWNEKLNPVELLGMTAFDSINVGEALLLLGATITIVVIAWFPLVKLRGYVSQRKKQLYDHILEQHAAAKGANDDVTVAKLEEEMKHLDEQSIWPNGDNNAKRFMNVMGALFLGAVVPALFIHLAALGTLNNWINPLKWFARK